MVLETKCVYDNSSRPQVVCLLKKYSAFFAFVVRYWNHKFPFITYRRCCAFLKLLHPFHHYFVTQVMWTYQGMPKTLATQFYFQRMFWCASKIMKTRSISNANNNQNFKAVDRCNSWWSQIRNQSFLFGDLLGVYESVQTNFQEQRKAGEQMMLSYSNIYSEDRSAWFLAVKGFLSRDSDRGKAFWLVMGH